MELHTKPTVLLNTHGFYDHLLHLFERLHGPRFARPSHRRLLQATGDAGHALGKQPSNQNLGAVGRRTRQEARYFWIRYLPPAAA